MCGVCDDDAARWVPSFRRMPRGEDASVPDAAAHDQVGTEHEVMAPTDEPWHALREERRPATACAAMCAADG
ncbi:unannotated protein [freshwater metagenome]|uniref:Unannotated protein n=1 Tax=freshwater metagenome TaxID=449393 RepID=A0A6J6HTS2_9ZZZZ